MSWCYSKHRPAMIDRRFFLTLALASAVTTSVGDLSIRVAHAETDPKVTVQGFYDVLLDCMQHCKELGFDGRFQKLAQSIGQAFDVPIMARIAVGSDWTARTQDSEYAVLDELNR